MKTDLDHLPDRKRRDLERIVEILFAEFDDATAIANAKWKKQGRILKVISTDRMRAGIGSKIRPAAIIPTTTFWSWSATRG